MVGPARSGRRSSGASVSPNLVVQAAITTASTSPTAYTHRHEAVRRIPSAMSGVTTGPTRKTAETVDIIRAIRSPA